MILKINSTRGHTGSLLVIYNKSMIYDIEGQWRGEGVSNFMKKCYEGVKVQRYLHYEGVGGNQIFRKKRCVTLE